MPLPNSPGEAVQPVSTPSPGPTTQSKLRVLIVDDDSSMARFLTSHLSRRGFEINIANNGEEASADDLPGVAFSLLVGLNAKQEASMYTPAQVQAMVDPLFPGPVRLPNLELLQESHSKQSECQRSLRAGTGTCRVTTY